MCGACSFALFSWVVAEELSFLENGRRAAAFFCHEPSDAKQLLLLHLLTSHSHLLLHGLHDPHCLHELPALHGLLATTGVRLRSEALTRIWAKILCLVGFHGEVVALCHVQHHKLVPVGAELVEGCRVVAKPREYLFANACVDILDDLAKLPNLSLAKQ